MQRLLLTTVCRPVGGPGQGPSMGVDVMKGQLCLEQGALRTAGVGQAYGLEYIAANVARPTTVLHWPSERELARELRRHDYSHVGLSYTFQLVPAMERTARLIRRHAPQAKLVLGGYGTAAPETHHLGDHVCEGDGIAFMRDLLGERVDEPIEHPTIVYGNKLLSLPIQAGRKVMIATGLGCANGCDFCATSAKFASYRPLVRDGDELFAVMNDLFERTGLDEFQLFDENFLVERERAERLAWLCEQHDRHFDFFTFASVRSLADWTASELVRLGVSAVWIGLEGKQAGYSKLHGEELAGLLARLRAAGILVVGSMIVGFDYQTPEIVQRELDEILDAAPTYLQALIYGPTPGTPLWRRLDQQQRWRTAPPGRPGGVPYERSDGFEAGFVHPHMSGEQLRALQRRCYRSDFERHGPSIFRAIGAWLEGWRNLESAPEPWMRARARVYERKLRACRPLLPVGIARAPTPRVRERLAALRDGLEALGPAGRRERLAARVILPAAERWTSFKLRHHIGQQPRLLRRRHRW